MSIRTVSASPTTSNAGLNTKSLQSGQPWVRNPQWLALPTVLSTDQKFVGLHAIFPSANFLALVAAGDYTVDWGDGVTENFASGVVAYHEYDYTNAAFDGTLTDAGYKQAIVTVTPQAGQNLTYLNLSQKHNQSGLQAYNSGFLDITVTSEFLTDYRVAMPTPSTTTGVINFNLLEQASIVNSDCRQLSNLFRNCRQLQCLGDFVTSSFTPVSKSVTFTDTGDLITSAGHGFRNGDSVLFTSIVSTTGINVDAQYYIINVTTDTFQVSTTYGGSALALTTDGTGVALYGTNMNSMFVNCSSLTSIPLFNTANVTNMGTMFSSCSSLATVPLFNTANVIDMSSMFQNCRGLKLIPLFNTANVTNMSSMFTACSSLTTVPLFNTANVTAMNSMFVNCTSLTSVPLFNTVAVTRMSSMFSACSSLTSIPLFNTAAVTVMSSMFVNCSSLTTVPLFNTANVTNMGSMFQNCSSFTSVPLFNTANVTAMNSMFNTCTSLTLVPALVTTAITSSSSFSSMFSTCPSLTKIEAKDFSFTFSVANCKLSAAALDEIYTNLPTVTGQTITVSGNYGTAGDDPTIATAKGWTVSG
jgi:surface protein